MPQFWFAASTEEFPPSAMLEQARAAEAAGFDAIGCSDHFAPWWPDGAATQAWVTLAAIGQQTTRPLFTAVTPIIHHYHPGVVAQAWMALEELYPGRAILGVGSGEALNEVPLGLDWPEPGEMLERFERGPGGDHAPVGRRDGDDGRRLVPSRARPGSTRAPRKPAADDRLRLRPAGRAHRRALRRRVVDDGRPGHGERGHRRLPRGVRRSTAATPGEIVLQAGFNLTADEQSAVESSRKWKATQLDESYNSELHDPAEMLAKADAEMTDEEFAKQGFLVGADPEEHVRRLGEIAAVEGATAVCLQQIGDADPVGSIRRYGESVLPRLR